MPMRDFDAQLTLMDSAQVFHWHRAGNGYVAVVENCIMTDQSENGAAKAYFDDGRDYDALKGEVSGFEVVERAVSLLPGLRVLNQPVWEALLAFILSANNNVSRIRNLVNALCVEYSDAYSYRGERYWGFPQPDTLAALDPMELKKRVTCGYRAEYLVETAKMVCQGFELEALREMPLEKARNELTKMKGVGPKVADCVLLFGLGHADAFPVDVWVGRLMEKWFHVCGSRAHMSEEARRLLGPHCGLVQQYLFHCARTGKMEL